MTNSFAAAIAAAADAAPMSNGQVPILQGRTLYADGDGLAYYCAGNDDTHPAEARKRLLDKLADAKRACGAEFVRVLTTASGSHKGHRYAVARAKPYQAQRSGKSRPKNWAYLREFLDAPDNGLTVESTSYAEADDLFAYYADGNNVIYTQDKDMRMVPGLHLNWTTHILSSLKPDEWAMEVDGKLYGRKWFWQQLLMGDTADNIPGLPKYEARLGVFKPIGEKTAEAMLADAGSDMGALLMCQRFYRSCYGDRWLVEMLEQGILLWMRRHPFNSFDVAAEGNPFAALRTHELWPAARSEIQQRINEATSYVTTQTESRGDSECADGVLEQPAPPVQAVPTAAPVGESSPRPRPLNRSGAWGLALIVQRPAR